MGLIILIQSIVLLLVVLSKCKKRKRAERLVKKGQSSYSKQRIIVMFSCSIQEDLELY